MLVTTFMTQVVVYAKTHYQRSGMYISLILVYLHCHSHLVATLYCLSPETELGTCIMVLNK